MAPGKNPSSARKEPAPGARTKTVHDAVHGSLDIGGLYLELMDSPELQRLHGIHQLGLAYLVFPGANHTRLEHSLGVWHVGHRMARAMGLKEGAEELSTACLLHDVGHPPYSHTLEYITHNILGMDHMQVTKDIITGRYDIVRKDEKLGARRTIPELLEDKGLDPAFVSSLVTGAGAHLPDSTLDRFAGGRRAGKSGNDYLAQLVHGALDADQIDYLLRDSHYTGVAYGIIDLPRLLKTATIHGGRLVIKKGGLAAVENMLVARGLMYSSVYFHRTVRIAETMIARAVEKMDDLRTMDLQRMVDSELMSFLAEAGGFQKDIATRLKYRRLFKRAYSVPVRGLGDDQARKFARLDDYRHRRSVEEEIERRAHVPEGYVIVDMPSKEVLVSEPRMHKTDVLILDEERGTLEPLYKHSPLARALQLRTVPDWAVMVSTDASMTDAVARAARSVLG